MSEPIKTTQTSTTSETAGSAQTPAKTDRGTSTGSFVTAKHRKRVLAIVVALSVVAVVMTLLLLNYDNPMDYGTNGYWKIVEMRSTNIIVMLVVAACQAFATVTFHTATNNRIITPSIMGFESLYIAVQTAAVFFFGVAGVTMISGMTQFILQVLLMVGFASILYGWLLSGRFSNIHIMLLVGVVIGGGLGSLSSFMQRMLDPNEFDVLSGRMFGNLSNASTEYLPLTIPVVIICCIIIWFRARKLNIIALGRDSANNLGLNHRRELMKTLLLVSILMAMTTSLVGPMTFLGFLIATLAYSLTDTYDHRVILPVAFLLGYTVLISAYFLLRNFFYAEGSVTVIIELIGGLVFLVVIMRKGRL